MATSDENAIKDLRSSITVKAETILHKEMLPKIIFLGELFDNVDLYKDSEFVLSEDLVGAPVNKMISDLCETMKEHVLGLIEHADILKLWVTLNIPKIEDGNNFGVGVQEEVLGMLVAGKTSGMAFLNNLKQYHLARAQMVKKILKYPNIDDYGRAINELDQKQYLHLRHCARDLRNNYAILFDSLNKNMEKILKPKGTAKHTSMY
eukprot:173825_1